MNTPLRDITLFPSGICNLKCKYCYVPKNKYMQLVHDILVESFTDEDYYSQLMHKLEAYFDTSKLHSISLWGAEPTYGFKIATPIITKLMNQYPSVDEIIWSTNFCTENCVDDVTALIDNINASLFRMQISIDGPSYINDVNRGNGVTSSIISNFKHLLSSLADISKSGKHLSLALKPTLTMDELRLLYDNDLIYDYFKFFEDNFIIPVYDLNNPNIHISHPHIGLANPAVYTTEDGLFYRDFIMKCDDIDKSHKLKYLTTSYKDRFNFHSANDHSFIKTRSYESPGGFCGAGVYNIGLLPDDKLCLCHRCFNFFVKEYVNEAIKYTSDMVDQRLFSTISENSVSIFNIDDCDKHLPIFRDYYKNNTTANLAAAANTLRLLAFCGQVDKKFKNEDMALKGAKLLRIAVSNCFMDHYIIAGTSSPQTASIMRLYMNGALEFQARGTQYEL